jgi:hypothetical protein
VPKALAVAKEGLMPHEKPHMSLIGGIIGISPISLASRTQR